MKLWQGEVLFEYDTRSKPETQSVRQENNEHNKAHSKARHCSLPDSIFLSFAQVFVIPGETYKYVSLA